jgi:prepilin-type N-terminal cleavage/methylation domain-containing protein
MPTGGAVGKRGSDRICVRDAGCARDGGFTLIESLTAAAILLVVAVAVITALVASAGWYSDARLRTESASVANYVMAQTLARNSSELTITPGASFPDKILASMPYASTTGTFTVLTSMVPTTTGGVDTTRVTVVAYPVNDPIDPTTHYGIHAASVVRDASGWQDDPTNTLVQEVPVTVDILVDNPTPGSESWTGQSGSVSFNGVRVQLLGADPTDAATYFKEVYYAVTDGFGTASFSAVHEGPYFVTCDPRFGPDLRPRYFPSKQNIAQGADNHVSLHVVRSVNTAVLRIGAFKGSGFTWSSPSLYYPNPLNPATGRRISVRPNLPGGGSYPDPGAAGLTYVGTVNAFGVAAIEVDYTLESGQTWTATLYNADGVTAGPSLIDSCPGSWPDLIGSNGRSRYGEIDVPSSGNLPQWAELGN